VKSCTKNLTIHFIGVSSIKFNPRIRFLILIIIFVLNLYAVTITMRRTIVVLSHVLVLNKYLRKKKMYYIKLSTKIQHLSI
jgi:hypothetical protein